MKYTFEYTKESEITQLLFSISSLYTNNTLLEYYPLYSKPNGINNIFVLPENLLTTDRYIHKLLENKELYFGEEQEQISDLYEYSKRYDKEIILVPIKFIEAKQNEWIKISDIFEKIISDLINYENWNKLNIKIRFTQFGTPSSYNWHKNNELYISNRLDTDMSEIASIIVLAIVKKNLFDTWKDKETEFFISKKWETCKGIAEYIMSQTKLKSIFPNYKSIFDNNNYAYSMKLVRESKEYAAKLGFLPQDKSLNIKNSNITYNDKQVLNFTNHEEMLLKFLLQNEAKYFNLNDLADAIWGSKSTDKFSISYIHKLIFQIRLKLKVLGIRRNIILSKRGLGYALIQ